MSLALFPNAIDRIDDLLYIGCLAAVAQSAALGFTHRVQLSAEPLPSHLSPRETLLYIQLEDDDQASLSDAISRFTTYMEQRDVRTDRVFLHCGGGISRSASLALVYLMRFKHMRLEHALPHLQQCRPCVRPNTGFMAQLMEYDKKSVEVVI